MSPMWKKLTKKVDLDDPTSYLDHVHLGCTQRQFAPNEEVFESQISPAGIVKLPLLTKLYAKAVAWSRDMEGQSNFNEE